jgi:hypothetical protein
MVKKCPVLSRVLVTPHAEQKTKKPPALVRAGRLLCYGGAGTNKDYTIQVCRSKAKAGRVDEVRTYLMTQDLEKELENLTELATIS